jgi:ABC-type antimicrobial peptide transport system permease subunit
VALVVALGIVTGALPAWQAMRLSIVDALRRA